MSRNLHQIILFFSVIFLFSCKQENQQTQINDGIQRLNIPEYISSIVYTAYNEDGYTSSRANQRYFELLKETKSNMSSFLYTCYTKNLTTFDIDCNTDRTPKEKYLAQIITESKNKNYPVNIRTYIDLENGSWRCNWNPSNKKKAFEKLLEMYSNMARKLETQKVEMWTIGAELCKMTSPQFSAFWLKIIEEIRTKYKGKIVYAPNFTESFEEYKYIEFLNKVDIIGVDYYPSFKSTKEPTEKVLRKFHHRMFLEYLKNIASIGRPIYISEIGIPVEEGGFEKPYAWDLKGEASVTKQSLWLSSVLKESQKFKLKGHSIWRFLEDDALKSEVKGFYLLHPVTIATLSQFGKNK
ncbi:MAG: hypothetical protein H6622_13600 [Halobacteriovoraceae bacterium]|nr:hypothetical protein [Halobacteriovoraceae bacterium]